MLGLAVQNYSKFMAKLIINYVVFVDSLRYKSDEREVFQFLCCGGK